MRVNPVRSSYPMLVGLLLGTLQTGLFFQLSFTLSSSYGTFLMITVCWLIGSAMGVSLEKKLPFPLRGLIAVALLAYFTCGALVLAAPFDTRLWPLYAALIVLTGLYPGVFFARMGQIYAARALFFRENNGFIIGLAGGTLAFLLLGRGVLWIVPTVIAAILMALPEPIATPQTEFIAEPPMADKAALNGLEG